MSLSSMLVFATLITLAFAVVSWHALEQPMLDFARGPRGGGALPAGPHSSV